MCIDIDVWPPFPRHDRLLRMTFWRNRYSIHIRSRDRDPIISEGSIEGEGWIKLPPEWIDRVTREFDELLDIKIRSAIERALADYTVVE